MAQMLERYVYKNQKKMRCGYTTGTCAAAAAKAAAQMLLSGRKVTEVSVRTPSDITLTLPVCEIQMKAHAVSCAVQKDSGDDPDITNKILIFAEVSYIHNNSNMNKSMDMTVKKCDTESERSDTAAVKPQIIVDGGVGIGRITKKGLARPVGAAALNCEYTVPEVSQTVILTRMEGRTPVPEKEKLSLLAQHGASMAVFLSAGHLKELQEQLCEGAYTPDTPCAIVYKASWAEQQCIKTTIKELEQKAREAGITKTALVLVGDFLGEQYAFSKLYDPEFQTEYRK